MRTVFYALSLSAIFVSFSIAQRVELDVYSNGQVPADPRLAKLKDLKGYFPFDVPSSKEAWQARAAEVRQRILVSAGLWPMPPRPAIDATVHGRIDRGDYTVEKVYFESYPGLFVTGNLYRPRNVSKPCPVVLSPHGHWKNGRFYECGKDEVAQQIFEGAERHEVAARFPLQARCVQLARMGCIVFHYDMLGYADSKPITYERAHRHRDPRPNLEDSNAWGLYTAQAEMRLQNVFGLQTFSSLRAVDFVSTLPDVDPTRIGVTGASGGGTQTMILAAIDPRISVSFPAVMVSTAMQGGCTCENAACLRVGTGNVEFAALFCPKPQGINAANDWTVDLATKGLPELKELYKLFGAEQNVEGYSLVHFPHNYNHVSRGKMYAWMNKHFHLGLGKWILEKPFEALSVSEMSVWNEEHPAPASDLAAEKEMLRAIAGISAQQHAESAAKPDRHRAFVRSALETLTATSWDRVTDIDRENISKIDSGDFWVFRDILRDGESELPVVFLHPKQWNKKVVVWTSGQGKASLLDKEVASPSVLRSEVRKLLAAGYAIAAPDLFRQGEFLTDGADAVERTRRVDNDRDFAGYTFGYNRTLLANRVHDLLLVLKFIESYDRTAQEIHLLAVDGATPFASVAAAIAGPRLHRLITDDAEFRFANLKSWQDVHFLPGAVKYGDLPEFLRCANAVQHVEGLGDVLQSFDVEENSAP